MVLYGQDMKMPQFYRGDTDASQTAQTDNLSEQILHKYNITEMRLATVQILGFFPPFRAATVLR